MTLLIELEYGRIEEEHVPDAVTWFKDVPPTMDGPWYNGVQDQAVTGEHRIRGPRSMRPLVRRAGAGWPQSARQRAGAADEVLPEQAPCL
ncbi:hypothetical protein J4573_16300 [Actinomadura barringtoniae]|uniref:Uncharacterized protein n=1 Tax=Actinomadura barringtoniae TaxID=1427535 RepID=A0A939PFA8_9ACTN|nr:hypothetical protein [Actinomadura barringtoniae]MBO2448664.1 hypothetical protein [Actinomadura barringtoniae]